MLCERCGKNQANVKLVRNLDDNSESIWLCIKCAEDITKLPLISEKDYDKEIDKLLNKFIDNIMEKKLEKKEKIQKAKKIKCQNCGITYEEVSKNWEFGCEKCYKYFGNKLNEKIRENNIKNKHLGKFPKVEEYILDNKKKIIRLKCELEDAIAIEHYEKAACIRDEIRNLENQCREVILKNE